MEYGKVTLTKEEIEKKRSESSFGEKVTEDIKEFDEGNKDSVKQQYNSGEVDSMKCDKCNGDGKYVERVRNNQVTAEEAHRVPSDPPYAGGMNTLRMQECEVCKGTGEVAN